MGRGFQAAPGLVCFDLDGTLYHDDRIYLRMIDYYFAGTPWEKEIGSVKAEMSRVLAGGNPAFRCGRFAPKEWGACPGPAAALLAVPTEAALLRPDPSPGPEMLVLYLRRLEPGHVPGPAYRLGR